VRTTKESPESQSSSSLYLTRPQRKLPLLSRPQSISQITTSLNRSTSLINAQTHSLLSQSHSISFPITHISTKRDLTFALKVSLSISLSIPFSIKLRCSTTLNKRQAQIRGFKETSSGNLTSGNDNESGELESFFLLSNTVFFWFGI
jgi:hypothetical protein